MCILIKSFQDVWHLHWVNSFSCFNHTGLHLHLIKFFLSPVPWRWRATSLLTFSQLSSPPCRQAQRGFQWQRRGQVERHLLNTSHLYLCFCTLVTCSACSLFCCLTLMPTSSSPLFSVYFCFFSVSLSSACLDPFTSAEAGDDSMPNLNPFLSKLVVDATHLPVVSSDGVSFSSRTSGHEMFGGNDSFCFPQVSTFLLIYLWSLLSMTTSLVHHVAKVWMLDVCA